MAENDSSKTEKATPKRRKDARKKGNVFKSQDIIVITSLIGSFIAMRYMVPVIYKTMVAWTDECMDYLANMTYLTNENVMMLQNKMVVNFLITGLPLLLCSAILVILVTGVQTKFLVAWASVKPQFNKLNPIEGVKKLFSMRNVVELIKNMLKISILGYILYTFIFERIPGILSLIAIEPFQGIVYMLNTIYELIVPVSLCFIVIAFFDYLYQRYDYEKNLRMTKQEIKDEYKQTEGNPEIKSRIKGMQRSLARSRMIQAVPTADVIVRNPTHFAIALKYDKDKNNAPVIVAKGQDELALRIIQVGEDHQVPIVENRPLARALYQTGDLNREIPPEFYGLVAEILVYVYKLNNQQI